MSEPPEPTDQLKPAAEREPPAGPETRVREFLDQRLAVPSPAESESGAVAQSADTAPQEHGQPQADTGPVSRRKLMEEYRRRQRQEEDQPGNPSADRC